MMSSFLTSRSTLLSVVLLVCTSLLMVHMSVAVDTSSTEAARDFQKTVPRFTGPSQLDENDTNYFINLAILFAIGLIFAVLTLLVAFFLHLSSLQLLCSST